MKSVTRVCLIFFFNSEKVTRDLLADDMMCSNRERPNDISVERRAVGIVCTTMRYSSCLKDLILDKEGFEWRKPILWLIEGLMCSGLNSIHFKTKCVVEISTCVYSRNVRSMIRCKAAAVQGLDLWVRYSHYC